MGALAWPWALRRLEQHVSEPCSNVWPSNGGGAWLQGVVTAGGDISRSLVPWAATTIGASAEPTALPSSHTTASTLSEPAMARGLEAPSPTELAQAQALAQFSSSADDA